jgi:predicted dithiol-disulfide oxidoreductase (DUF899 family)
MGKIFPNESDGYRAARDELLKREVALRREMEAVAAALRALPPGGTVPEDYVFDRIGADGAPEEVRLSELFRDGGDTVLIYHYMFPRHAQDNRPGPSSGPFADLPLAEGPCPSCTALLDMWEGTMPHFEGLGGALYAVTKAPIGRVAAFARGHGWRNIRLLSAAGSNFKRHYGGEDPDGQQMPMMTVLHRGTDGVIRLSWASELLLEPSDPGQDMRHMGTVEPLWTLFDLTPGGRPQEEEQLDYSCCDAASAAPASSPD